MKTICWMTLLLVTALNNRLLAQCNTVNTTRGEVKVAVPFAVSLGVPVAPLAPYYYSYRQFQTQASPPTDASDSPLANPDESDSALWPALRGRSSSALAVHCAACHHGPAPQGNVQFDRPALLSNAERLAAIRAVTTGRMPQDKRLTADELRAVIEELARSD